MESRPSGKCDARAQQAVRWLAFVTVPLAFGVWSLALGQDANWDLQNYHWYNPYAFLHWRFGQDIAPANIQSYESPLFDIPWYLLAQIAPARVVGFVIGAVHSANFLLVYAISFRLLPIASVVAREFSAIALAIVGILGVVTINLIGTTFNDLIVSIGVLGSLLLTIEVFPLTVAADILPQTLANTGTRSLKRVFVAGLPLGIAMAGKLTAAPFAVAFVMAFFATSIPKRRALEFALLFGCGVAVPFLIIHGAWSMWLWHEFQNPVFPFYNEIFHSPLTTLKNEFDPFRKKPHGLLQLLFFPLFHLNDPLAFSNVQTIDYRLAAANIIVPTALLARRIFPATKTMPDRARYLFASCIVSYTLWLLLFDYYRYLLALYMIIPLIITILLLDLPGPRVLNASTIAVVLMALILTGKGESWGRIPWTDRFVEAAPGELRLAADPGKTLLVLLDSPLAYLVPLLPANISAVDLDTQIAPLEPADFPWNVRRHEKINQPWEAIYGVSSGGIWTQEFKRRLKSFRLTAELSTCKILKTNLAEAAPLDFKPVFCKLERLESGEPQWPLPTELVH